MLSSGAGREDVHHRERQSSSGVQTGCDLSLQRPRGPQEPVPRVQVLTRSHADLVRSGLFEKGFWWRLVSSADAGLLTKPL